MGNTHLSINVLTQYYLVSAYYMYIIVSKAGTISIAKSIYSGKGILANVMLSQRSQTQKKHTLYVKCREYENRKDRK